MQKGPCGKIKASGRLGRCNRSLAAFCGCSRGCSAAREGQAERPAPQRSPHTSICARQLTKSKSYADFAPTNDVVRRRMHQ
eukprot:1221818-Pleurochrysis_carterae.AAC.2